MATRKDKSRTRTYSFKSVGESIQDYNSRTIDNKIKPIPIGIQTPLTIDKGLFKMHYDIKTLIKDNLRNLIMTNKGERLGNTGFGADLRKIQYGVANEEEAEGKMMQNIKSAVRLYMPFVILQDFSTKTIGDEKTGTKSLILRITYGVPKLGTEQYGIQLILPIGG